MSHPMTMPVTFVLAALAAVAGAVLLVGAVAARITGDDPVAALAHQARRVWGRIAGRGTDRERPGLAPARPRRSLPPARDTVLRVPATRDDHADTGAGQR